MIPIHHLKPFLRESLELKHFRENLEPYQSGHNSKYVNNDQSKRKLDRESIAAAALPLKPSQLVVALVTLNLPRQPSRHGWERFLYMDEQTQGTTDPRMCRP